jgi:hypothetical protein
MYPQDVDRESGCRLPLPRREELNSNNYRATMGEMRGFYETGATNYPQIYANYAFEKWLEFLVLNGIIRVSDNIIGATPIAKALIPYMRMRGYLVTKAAG